MKKSNTYNLLLCALAVAINVALGTIVSWLHIPFLFLDTLGTIFISTQFKMRYGILTGIATNLILSIFTGATAIPFALVNVAIAIVVTLISRGTGFTFPKAILSGIILGILCPLIGTPIRILLFSGFTGSGTDILILALKATGQSLFASTFLSTILANLVDKIISCLLIAFIIKLPAVEKYKQRTGH